MQRNIPSSTDMMKALLRADLITQWRNRRSIILILLVPIAILLSWKKVIDQVGVPYVFSTCIAVGLIAIGLMGYSNSVARDRDKGVFQRLRVTPLPSWAIMASRLIVQLSMILLLTALVFLAGYNMDHISLVAAGYGMAFVAALAGGLVYLGMGQIIVGLIKNPETVNSTSRLVYFLFIMIGMMSRFIPWEMLHEIVKWSPYGTVQRILSASMVPSTWTSDSTTALLLTLGYAAVFFAIGIRRFQWNTK